MSDRPKRNRRPPQRYEPEEIPVDDYDDDYSAEAPASGMPEDVGVEVDRKRWKGEFDEFDDDDEEEFGDEPNEYDMNDGFAVADDYESYEDGKSDEEDEFEDDEEEFDEDDDDDDRDYEESYEPDVVDPEVVAAYHDSREE